MVAVYKYLSTVVAVYTGIYEIWLAFRRQGRSPHEMFIRTMEIKIDQMKRDVEREGRREERRKEFERRTGHKLAGGIEQPQSPYRSRRLSLFRPRELPAIPGGHAADGDGNPTGAFALEMGPVDTGSRIIDRRARGERAHAVIEEEEQRTRASQDGVRDRLH